MDTESRRLQVEEGIVLLRRRWLRTVRPSARCTRHVTVPRLLWLHSCLLGADAVGRVERRANGDAKGTDIAKRVDTIASRTNERRQLCVLTIVPLRPSGDGRSSRRGNRWGEGGLGRGEGGIDQRLGRLRWRRRDGRRKAGKGIVTSERGLLRYEGLRDELLLLLLLLHLLHVGLLLKHLLVLRLLLRLLLLGFELWRVSEVSGIAG